MKHINLYHDRGNINLVNIVSQHATAFPQKIAFGFLPDGENLEAVLTYSDLNRQVKILAAHLQSRSLAGQCVLLHFKPGLEFIISFWACLYAGVIAVPTHLAKPNTNNWRRLESIILDANASAFLTASDTYSILHKDFDESAALKDIPVLQVDLIINSDSNLEYIEPPLTNDTIAFLQYTSGSTGNPKGVIVSHGNLIHNEEILRTGCDTNKDSIFVSWLPLFHDMGLIGKVIHSAYLGATCYLMPPAVFIQKPFLWLKAISDFRATTSFAPNFAYELCVNRITEDERKQLDLSCWITALNGAEPIRASTMKAFAEYFAPTGLALAACYPGYGLAEATLMVSGHVDRESHPISEKFNINGLEKGQAILADNNSSEDEARDIVCCGRPLLDLDLVIVDPESKLPLSDGHIGEIWIAGGSVALGYWKNERATEETFRATLASNPDKPYMRTGDLGFLLNGRIYLSGRLKDVFIIRGRNHYPQDIEATTQTASTDLSIDRAAAFSVPNELGEEQLVVVQEVKRTSMRNVQPELIIPQIRRRIAEEHDLHAHRIVLLRPGQLPRTSSGKIQRRLCRQQFLEGSLITVEGISPYGELLDISAKSDENKNIPHPDINELLSWLRNYSSKRINSRLMDERRALTPSVILDLGNKGLLGMIVPTEYGGPGYSYSDLISAVELLGAIDQSLALLVLLNNVLGIYPILKFGTDDQRQKILPQLGTGRALAAFALTEPVAGSNPRAIRSTLNPLNNNTWALTGEKCWIGSAAWSSYINVFAQEYDTNGQVLGMSAFIVEQQDAGVIQGAEAPTMGMRAMLQNAVHFQSVVLSDERRLGSAGKGMEVAQAAMNLGRLGIGAMGLGGIRRCLQLILRYASKRTISTGLLLDNPVVQCSIKELTYSAASLESTIRYATSKLHKQTAIETEIYSAIKIAGSEFFWGASDTLIQLLGGRGYIENNVAPQLMRDARILRIFEGPTETLIADLGSRLANKEAAENLFSVGLKNEECAKRFSTSVHKLIRIHEGTNIEDRLLCNFMIGNLAFWTTLIATNEESDSTTKQWLAQQFDKCLDGYLLNGLQTNSKNESDFIDSFLNSNNTFLANIDQSLAGEDWNVDPTLASTPIHFKTPSNEKSLKDFSSSSSGTQNDFKQQSAIMEQTNTVNQEAMIKKIATWITKNMRVKLPSILNQLTFAELGLDSFNSALLTNDLSTELGLEIDLTSVWNFPTIGQYAQHLVQICTAIDPEQTLRASTNGSNKTISEMTEQEAELQLLELLN